MKLCVQWATGPASPWDNVDSKDWPMTPSKPPPPIDRQPIFDDQGGIAGFNGTPVTIDNTFGWIQRLFIQGMQFSGSSLDHVAVVDAGDHVKLIVWNPDSAREVRFYDEWGSWDHPMRDGIVTIGTKDKPAPRQEATIYPKDENLARYQANPIRYNAGPAIVLPRAQFIEPDPSLVRHGIWVTDKLYREGQEIAPYGSYKDWIIN